MITHAYYLSELGMLELTAEADVLLSCQFVTLEKSIASQVAPTPLLTECVAQLDAYFRGTLQQFSVPLQPKGSTFACQVWQQLGKIPYGKTASYGEIAAAIARPQAARAIGQANHCNPIAIIIPCHRVIAKQGALSGYAGGVWRKSWLLAHEATSVATRSIGQV